MKMFKKIMAVALVGVMALSMLTGCAITDSVKEKAAERGLETAAKVAMGKDVEFTQVDKTAYKDAMKTVKDSIKSKNYKTAEVAGVPSATTNDYSVVVIAEPKSATTSNAWEKVGASILAATPNGVYTEAANSGKTLKAKVHIEAVEGVDANGKDQTYFVFVFAAKEAAYNK